MIIPTVGRGDVPRRRPGVEWVVLDGEAVLYDGVAESLHHLNPGATAVWVACDGSSSVAAIMTSLEASHSGGDRIRADVLGIVTQLFGEGLLDLA